LENQPCGDRLRDQHSNRGVAPHAAGSAVLGVPENACVYLACGMTDL